MSDDGRQPPTEPAGRRHRRRVTRWAVALSTLAAVVVVAGWWFAGRKVWTDGATIRRAAADPELREVLWTRAQPLDDAFNTENQEYEPSVSADGAEIYFVRGKPSANADVYVSRRAGAAWATPEPVSSINTDVDELGPRLTPDGRFLLFYSDREGGIGQYDIWAAPRLAGGDGVAFGEPFNLGPAVNSEFNEYGPAPTPDGTGLLFATNRKSAVTEQREAWRATIRQNDSGDYDIFLATLESPDAVGALPHALPPVRIAGPRPTTAPTMQPSGEALPPLPPGEGGGEGGVGVEVRNLPNDTPSPQPSPEGRGGEDDAAPHLAYQPAQELHGVNTPHHDGASCMSPAGDFLYFASNRPGGLGKFDLYRGRLTAAVVSAIENLGPAINTPDNEADPQLAVGGFHLMFSSDAEGTRGGYDLLASESREVYAQRDARPLPAVGWNAWILLVALLALLPLLMYLRGWDDHRLNLLQKCLLVSVLFHVVLTVLFSLYHVSRDIVQYVKKQQEMELAVDLRGVDAETLIASEIRGQPRLDLPVQAPAPVEVAQSPIDVPLESLEPIDVGADLTVPQAQFDPGRMVVEVPAAKSDAAQPDQVMAAPAPEPTSQLPDFDITLPRAQVAAPEVEMDTPAEVQPDLARRDVTEPVAPGPLPCR